MSLICALAFAAAPAAFAQGPTQQGYDVRSQNPESLSAIDALPTADTSDGTDPAAQEEVVSAESGDSLPFTGLDVGIVALLGVALLGTGLAVRQVARS
jgi:hypothetical protein